MISLSWLPYPEATIANYRIYRSLIGFSATLPLPAALAGLTLQLAMNGGTTQTITFNGVQDAITVINATLQGGQAYPSTLAPTTFIVRSNIREAPGSVQIVGGTALTLLAITSVRTITQLSENFLLATVPSLVDPTVPVTFDDPDGSLYDYYAVTSLDSVGNESLKTSWRQAITTTGPVCVIEGIVIDASGARIPDAEVRATPSNYPTDSGTGIQLAKEPIETLSDETGRFSIVLLQNTLVRIDIPCVGYSRNVTVPAQSYAFLTDLDVELDYQFNPDPNLAGA
jgi:hypothetical protein